MKEKGINNITEEHLKVKLKIVWPPMLPVDRKSLIDELAIRATHNLGSNELLMSLLGDIPNIEDEKAKILAEKKEAIALLPKPVPAGGTSSSEDESDKVPPKKNKDTPDTPPTKPVKKE